MKGINIKVPNDVHKFLTNYKLDYELKSLDQAITEIVKYVRDTK